MPSFGGLIEYSHAYILCSPRIPFLVSFDISLRISFSIGYFTARLNLGISPEFRHFLHPVIFFPLKSFQLLLALLASSRSFLRRPTLCWFRSYLFFCCCRKYYVCFIFFAVFVSSMYVRTHNWTKRRKNRFAMVHR